MNDNSTLEFDIILEQLAANAQTESVKHRCENLNPSLSEAQVRRWNEETTQARSIIDSCGLPPLPSMENLRKALTLIEADAMLLPEQIMHVAAFLVSCRRMKHYLKKAEAPELDISFFGNGINALEELEEEIGRCIVNGLVDDKSSPTLAGIRRQMLLTADQIKHKLDALLRKNTKWFSESFVSKRNGRWTLPVRREYKNDVSGILVDMSHKGSTCFIEPVSVGKLTIALATLEIEEDSEVRRILYTLTALIGEYVPQLKLNIETLETLDFLFAKGKLSLQMKASPVRVEAGRTVRLIGARHPLLNPTDAVPLDFEIGGQINGVVITGPNTGGKTVALKTIGLLTLMAQSGLHIPADKDSILCMRSSVLCDIGDGQSIAANLSTFSAHMKNIIAILSKTGHETLVLLDELGSGTDPAEGMGLAVAILDELCASRCLFVVTTHYPQVKDYAARKPGLINARMAFDKQSLSPLYRLELGEAGESCALYIAERLGMPNQIVERARAVSSGEQADSVLPELEVVVLDTVAAESSKIEKADKPKPQKPLRSESFSIGDSVMVYPQKEIGLVYQKANGVGELGVQIKGVKKIINHKRVKLHVPAGELYPDDYDFSIVFDSVENRKARRILGKRYEPGTVVVLDEGKTIK